MARRAAIRARACRTRAGTTTTPAAPERRPHRSTPACSTPPSPDARLGRLGLVSGRVTSADAVGSSMASDRIRLRRARRRRTPRRRTPPPCRTPRGHARVADALADRRRGPALSVWPGRALPPSTLVCEPIVRCDAHVDCAPGFCVNGICEGEVAGAATAPRAGPAAAATARCWAPAWTTRSAPRRLTATTGPVAAAATTWSAPARRAASSGACREPQTCFGDDFCLAGRQCAPEGYCTPDGLCVEDAHGDLGASESALAIGLEALADLLLCEGTDRLVRLVDGSPSVAVRPAAGGAGPLTLELFAADQPFGALDYDLGRSGVSWVSMPAGQWLVRVSAPAGGNGPYTLDAREPASRTRTNARGATTRAEARPR